MCRFLLLSLICMSALAACTTEHMSELERLQKDLATIEDEAQRQQRVDAFMQHVKATGAPLLENDTTAVFIYQGPAAQVRVSGDMTQWTEAIDLEQIEGTDVFYYRGVYPAGARLEYLMLIDDQFPVADPLCKNRVLNGLGAHAELVMPGYTYHPVFDAVRDGTPGGYDRVTRHLLPAGLMGYETEIHVYTPPGYQTSDALYPTVYIQDGRDYIEFAHTPAVLDALIKKGDIDPVLAVFISPPNRHQPEAPNRTTEYGLNPDYARFMAEEVVPFVGAHYRSLDNPSARLVAGDSYAGLVSAYIPFQHPEVFGLGYSQSGYLSLQDNTLIEAYQEAETKPIHLYVDIGIYEQQVGKGWLPDEEIDFLRGNRAFKEVLAVKGYDFVYREYPEGHTWGNWRAHLIDGLIHFFAPNQAG